MVCVHMNFGAFMATHASVTQLRQWLNDHRENTEKKLTGADKITRWLIAKFPLSVYPLQYFSMLSFFMVPVFLAAFSFGWKEVTTPLLIAGILVTSPQIVSWCLGWNWWQSISKSVPARSLVVEDLVKKCHRIQRYHPSLRNEMQQVLRVLQNPSEFAVNGLEAHLRNILLELPAGAETMEEVDVEEEHNSQAGVDHRKGHA